ncbi:PKD domain-containing protein [Tessaracoccus antarcticus]|uniref:PKD domain-containing protein n=1 Tax=Tessaracoccus antarcticus TaxID=2479848 RepID=A0A3M0GLG8_9ACTN|nr:PKD domain-containing protein [Tessaracoccus antarcticus]RMB58146.1 PKD domain-containing protein [Tessaracoccus antarcticus]
MCAIITTTALVAGFAASMEKAAAAEPIPLPATVSADGLPTVQIDKGVIWASEIVGDIAYVGGEFTNARPAGAAVGTNLIPRSNFLAFSISTGVLVSSMAPSFNGRINDITASPDKTKLYVVGNFTTVNGLTRNRIAVFDLPSGNLNSTVVPNINGTTQSVAATNDTIYVGGYFSAVNNSARARIAAVRASNGSLLPFKPIVDNGMVQALAASPDGSSLVLAGSFTSVAGGSTNPGYGLSRVDGVTGNQLPLPVNSEVRNAGQNSGITRLKSDGTNFYGVGWHFGSGGNSEGAFSANWSDGTLKWLEDCHGDSYDIAPTKDVVYLASHKHYCGNSGGFPQTEPWSFYHSTAVTKTVEGVNTSDIYGYPDHPGTPRPDILNWFPQTDVGTYTGKSQAVWTVDGTDDYVIYGGEFPRVNGKTQQGLVRYAVRDKAPNLQGPRFLRNQTSWAPSVTSASSGSVRIGYSTVWDRDDLNLTYRVYRDSENPAGLVDERLKSNVFWKPESVRLMDGNLTPASTHRYRVTATDPWNNVLRSDWVNVTVSSTALSPYALAVYNDEAQSYWRLGEASGDTAVDWVGSTDLTIQGGASRGTAGAVAADSDKATTFAGGYASTGVTTDGPSSFAVEAWIQTTTTSGGKIIGFGGAATGDSGSYDRHVYMDNAGRILFGVYPGAVKTVSSTASFNDGQWHHVVASLGSEGMRLYVDGKRVGQDVTVTSAQSYSGNWRIGGDNLNGWTNQPTSNYFSGSIDDVAVYAAPLTVSDIRAHYVASGRTVDVPPAPVDAYGALVHEADPELYWRYDESSGPALSDAGEQGVPGQLAGDFQRNEPGALVGGTGKAITFKQTSCNWWQMGCTPTNGGNAFSTINFVGPNAYSLETWFRTTTTSGGKLIGLGDAQTGGSSNYDRHVYMQNDGKLVFGTWSGQTNTIFTASPLNDGLWHHVVATQDASGMNLYVDGISQGTNPATAAQNFIGYWRVGGDSTWGSSSPNLIGSFDETAVYGRALTATEAATHFAVGSGAAAPNQPPTASFIATATDLKVDVDASASTDSDGSVNIYGWDFGDGTTGTGITTTHTYSTAGAHTITLTVTDDKSATATTTREITATAPNVAPTASFTVATNGLSVSVDGNGSTDPDGSIASWAWDFGDGTTAATATATHTYAAAGSHTITLIVKDDKGLSGSTTKDVVAVGPNQAPIASFTSAVNGLSVSLNAAASNDPDGTITTYQWDLGDGSSAAGVTTTHTYTSPGSYSVILTVTDNANATATRTNSVTVVNPVSGILAQDKFERTSATGWGTANIGGPWTLRGTASRFNVANGAGNISVPSASTLYADLNQISSTSTRVEAVFSVDKLVEAQYVAVVGRRIGPNSYIARLRLQSDGGAKLYLLDNSTSLAPFLTIPAGTITPGQKYTIVLETIGTAPTALKAKFYPFGGTEPTWQVQSSNVDPALQAAGAVSVFSYLPNTTQAPSTVSFDTITVTDPAIG